MYKPDELGTSSAFISRPVAVRPGRADSGQSALSEATALSAITGAGVAATACDVMGQGDEAGHSSPSVNRCWAGFERRGQKNIRSNDLQVHQPGRRDFSRFAGLGVDSKPLRHGLGLNLADAGDFAGATEGGDDFFIVHAKLKHTFTEKASMLSQDVCKLRPMNYGERLGYAIKLAGSSRRLLAQAVGLTEQAIGQCIRGETEFLKVEGSARAAAFLGVNHWWLATGEGEPQQDEGWPFNLFTRSDYALLTQQQRDDAENALAGAIQRARGESPPVETMAAYAERRRNPAPSLLNKINPIKKRE